MNRMMTYFGMLKEFGMRPDEVDKLDATFVDEVGILMTKLREEERRATSRR